MLFFPARTFSHLTKDYGLRLKESLIAVGNFLDIEPEVPLEPAINQTEPLEDTVKFSQLGTFSEDVTNTDEAMTTDEKPRTSALSGSDELQCDTSAPTSLS